MGRSFLPLIPVGEYHAFRFSDSRLFNLFRDRQHSTQKICVPEWVKLRGPSKSNVVDRGKGTFVRRWELNEALCKMLIDINQLVNNCTGLVEKMWFSMGKGKMSVSPCLVMFRIAISKNFRIPSGQQAPPNLFADIVRAFFSGETSR
jgi:hypothetical protein